MKVNEYIEKFHMDDKDQSKFNHREFLNAFANEFNTMVSNVKTYEEFQKVVYQMDQKFRDIKNLRTKKKNLSDKLWKAFFAIYVVPKRKALFPKQQAKIESKRNGKNN